LHRLELAANGDEAPANPRKAVSQEVRQRIVPDPTSPDLGAARNSGFPGGSRGRDLSGDSKQLLGPLLGHSFHEIVALDHDIVPCFTGAAGMPRYRLIAFSVSLTRSWFRV